MNSLIITKLIIHFPFIIIFERVNVIGIVNMITIIGTSELDNPKYLIRMLINIRFTKY